MTTTEFVDDGAGAVRALRGHEVETVLEDGRPVFEKVAGTEFELECDLVLLAMGFVGTERRGVGGRARARVDARGAVAADAGTGPPTSTACSSVAIRPGAEPHRLGHRRGTLGRGRRRPLAHGRDGTCPHPSSRGNSRCADAQEAAWTQRWSLGPEVLATKWGAASQRSGRRVIFGVRNLEIGEKAAGTIRAENKEADVRCELLDLADLKSVSAFGARMRDNNDRLDVLVNNAGVVMPPIRQTTADGFELHFGTNHLGHFALTSALLPLLRAADSPRIVVVGSLAHRMARIDFDDLQAAQSYRKFKAYGQSKLANLLFMTELQRRSDAAGWGLISVGAHPGFARTGAMMEPGDSLENHRFAQALSGLIPKAEAAARPTIHAATTPDVAPAAYYGPTGVGEIGGRVGPAKLAARAQDPALAARLWDVSETLTALSFDDPLR